MKAFKDRFKKGDIIRTGGHIRTGQLMVVEFFGQDIGFWEQGGSYCCHDLFIENQKWSAYETGEFTLATDEDIISELAKRVDSLVNIVSDFGEIEVDINDEMMYITLDEGSVILDPKAAIELRDVINKYVGEL